MPDPRETRTELADLWRERMQEAQAKYKEAIIKYKQVLRDQQQGRIPSPDGSYALSQAHQAESAALREYLRVLRIFNDLVVHGTRPPDE